MAARLETVRGSGIFAQLLYRIGYLICVPWEERTGSSQLGVGIVPVIFVDLGVYRGIPVVVVAVDGHRSICGRLWMLGLGVPRKVSRVLCLKILTYSCHIRRR